MDGVCASDESDMNSLVSVVIPAYNAAAYLPDAINSVLSQTRPADEVIVVDDGSKDSTGELAESYGDKVFCVRQSNSGGVAEDFVSVRLDRESTRLTSSNG